MKHFLVLIFLVYTIIEVYSSDLDLEANLDEVLKAHNIEIPETPSTIEETPELIINISEEEFQKVLDSNANSLVYFYVPFCSTCKEFDMLLEEVAQKTKELNLNVKFVKIDSDKYPTASENFIINDYPATFMVQNGKKIIPFNEEKTVENYINFIQKLLAPPVVDSEPTPSSTESVQIEIKEIKDLNTLISMLKKKSVKHLLLYIGDNKKLDMIHKHIIDEKDCQLYYSNNTEILKKYQIEPQEYEVIHFKYSNKQNDYVENILNLNKKSVRLEIVNELITTSMKSKVERLTDSNLDRILDTGFPSVVIVLPDFSNETQVESLMNEMNIVRKKFPRDLWYFITSFNQTNVKVFLDLLRISTEMLPTVLTFDGSAPKDTNEVRKYLWNRGEINSENLQLYIQDFYNNNLPIFLASEDIPTQPLNEYGVYKVVGKTLNDVVLNSSGKEILLLLCTIYHDDCPKLQKMYNNVAQKLSGNEKLLVATIDPAANEMDNLTLDHIPYLMFLHDVPNKLGNHLKFEGKFTTKEMVEFVMKNAKYNISESTLENESSIYSDEEKINITRKSIEEEGQEQEEKEGDDKDDSNLGGLENLGDLSGLGDLGGFGQGGNLEGLEEMLKTLMGSEDFDLGALGGGKGIADLLKQEFDADKISEGAKEIIKEDQQSVEQTSTAQIEQTGEASSSESQIGNTNAQNSESKIETVNIKEDF